MGPKRDPNPTSCPQKAAGKACIYRIDEGMRQHPSRISVSHCRSLHLCTAAVTGRRRRGKYAPLASVHHLIQPVLILEHLYALSPFSASHWQDTSSLRKFEIELAGVHTGSRLQHCGLSPSPPGPWPPVTHVAGQGQRWRVGMAPTALRPKVQDGVVGGDSWWVQEQDISCQWGAETLSFAWYHKTRMHVRVRRGPASGNRRPARSRRRKSNGPHL